MGFAMQHWVALLVVLLVGVYVGRKTSLGAGLPVIG